jgi:protein SCO1/2
MMNKNIKKRLVRVAVLSAIALVVGAGMGWFQVRNTSPPPDRSMPIAGVKIGGPFTLTDQDGKVVTEKNYAGAYKLIYFGFTACPAICPTELAKMTQVLNGLGKDAEAIQPLFITLDPERDDVKTIKNYMSLFHPRFQGLTGTVDQIEAVKKTYRVYGAKEQTDSAMEYTINHSSYIYLMSPADELISIYKAEDQAAFITEDIKSKIEFGQTD